MLMQHPGDAQRGRGITQYSCDGFCRCLHSRRVLKVLLCSCDCHPRYGHTSPSLHKLQCVSQSGLGHFSAECMLVAWCSSLTRAPVLPYLCARSCQAPAAWVGA